MPSKQDLSFVGIQAVLLLALLFDPFPIVDLVHPWSGFLGMLICLVAVLFGLVALVQLGSNLTPWPSPKTDSSLVTSGTYAWARHPIYAALIWFGFGLSIWFMSPWRFGISILLFFLFIKKSTYEENMLRNRYPEYANYAKRVKRFGL